MDEILKLRADYEKNGGINYQYINAKNWVDAHFQLGQLLATEINQIASDRFSKAEFDLSFQVRLAKLCLDYLQSKSNEEKIGSLIKLYLDCLEAWAEGCSLSVTNYKLSKLELAIILQNDVVGCITTLIRGNSGDVKLIHSEEDVSGTIKKPTVINFNIQESNQKITSFIYPGLLPGPAFSFSEKMIMANDFLYTNHCQEYHQKKQAFSLVNILTWILFITQDYDLAENYAAKLSPFVDGNAINLIDLQSRLNHSEQAIISAKTIEVAGDQVKTKELSENPQSYQVQVNVFNQPDSLICQNHETINPNKRVLYVNRVKLIADFLDENLDLPFPKIAFFQTLQNGGEYTPANKDVKATFLANVSSEKIDYKIIAGPLLESDLQNNKV